MSKLKNLIWLGDSLKNIREFPEEVKKEIGHALYLIQNGKTPPSVKPFKGMKLSSMEIVTNFNKDTYRTVYTIKIDEVVYILHCFQKKSKSGIKTPKEDVELIKKRIQDAIQLSRLNE